MAAAPRGARRTAAGRGRAGLGARRLAHRPHRLGARWTEAGGRGHRPPVATGGAVGAHAAGGGGAGGARPRDRPAAGQQGPAETARQPGPAVARRRGPAEGGSDRLPGTHEHGRERADGALRLRRPGAPPRTAIAASGRRQLFGRPEAAGARAAHDRCDAGRPLPGAGAGLEGDSATGASLARARTDRCLRRACAAAGRGGTSRARHLAAGRRRGARHAFCRHARASRRHRFRATGPGAVLAAGAAHAAVRARRGRTRGQCALAPAGRPAQCDGRALGRAPAAGAVRARRGRVARRHGAGEGDRGESRRRQHRGQWCMGGQRLELRGTRRRGRPFATAWQPGTSAAHRSRQAQGRRQGGRLRR